MKKISKILKEIKINGFSVVENFLSPKKCNKYIDQFEIILKKRIKNKEYIGKDNTVVLYNYFKENLKLTNLFVNNLIDNVMTQLIDEDYVLISTAARNKKKINLKLKKTKKPVDTGNKWHVDNRHLGGIALKPSLNYFAVIALNEFNKENGATQYIPKSHLFKKKINSQKQNKFKTILAKKGSIIFIDSNLAHRAGDPGNIDRWSIFNLYSAWFVKPYYQFDKIVKKKKLLKKVKKLLHFNSTPPDNQNIRISTLIKKK